MTLIQEQAAPFARRSPSTRNGELLSGIKAREGVLAQHSHHSHTTCFL